MAFYLPPASTINKFTGGYRAASDYTDLSDTETNDSENVVYNVGGDLEKRSGSRKILNSRLVSSTGGSGRPVTGHYFFEKLGSSQTYNVVAAGDSLFNYSSATAASILTGLTDNSETFWQFTQVQDPRSGSDDVLIGVNGVNNPVLWNGSASAIFLSAVAGSSGVVPAKFILSHKQRIYLLNITDSTDVDAQAKVLISGFGSDGAPDPHVFRDEFYCGGSSKGGDIRGAAILNDQVVIGTRSSWWKFTAGAGTALDTAALQQLEDSIGIYAPYSVVNTGAFVIFLSDQGIYAFDGINFVHLSEKVDEVLFSIANQSRLQFAKSTYDQETRRYVLYFATNGSTRNDAALVYDIKQKVWQPLITGRQVNWISTFDDSNGMSRLIYADYGGYLFQDDVGTNDGIETGYNGTVSASTYSTLTDNQAFPTANDGLAGIIVTIYSGTGEGQRRVIASNTSAVLTLESPWTTPPDSTSKYTVGGVLAHWRSKDFDFGGHDIAKLFRHLRIRTEESGNFTMTVHYIVDFKDLPEATSRDVSLIEDGFAWGVGLWGQARWGGKSNIIRKISLRSTSTQPSIGNHLAIRFSNPMANQTFRISGFDIELKAVGKR